MPKQLPEVEYLPTGPKPSLGCGWSLFWVFIGLPLAVAIPFLLSPVLGALIYYSGLAVVAIWTWNRYRARATWSRQDDVDRYASQVMSETFTLMAGRHEPLSDASPGLRSIHDARVGEVSQHFDQGISAAVTGWLRHEFSLHGWGVGVSLDSLGLGTGKLGLSGSSSVALGVHGVLRDDLSGDGFVAVLERDLPSGTVDTVRVIVPSEPACREYVANLVSAIGARVGPGTQLDSTCRTHAPRLASSFPCDVAHASDQLRAVLRQPAERRPSVSVVGEDLGGSVILGGAIRIGPDGPWQQLFPIVRSREILDSAGALTAKLPAEA